MLHSRGKTGRGRDKIFVQTGSIYIASRRQLYSQPVSCCPGRTGRNIIQTVPRDNNINWAYNTQKRVYFVTGRQKQSNYTDAIIITYHVVIR